MYNCTFHSLLKSGKFNLYKCVEGLTLLKNVFSKKISRLATYYAVNYMFLIFIFL